MWKIKTYVILFVCGLIVIYYFGNFLNIYFNLSVKEEKKAVLLTYNLLCNYSNSSSFFFGNRTKREPNFIDNHPILIWYQSKLKKKDKTCLSFFSVTWEFNIKNKSKSTSFLFNDHPDGSLLRNIFIVFIIYFFCPLP